MAKLKNPINVRGDECESGHVLIHLGGKNGVPKCRKKPNRKQLRKSKRSCPMELKDKAKGKNMYCITKTIAPSADVVNKHRFGKYMTERQVQKIIDIRTDSAKAEARKMGLEPIIIKKKLPNGHSVSVPMRSLSPASVSKMKFTFEKGKVKTFKAPLGHIMAAKLLPKSNLRGILNAPEAILARNTLKSLAMTKAEKAEFKSMPKAEQESEKRKALKLRKNALHELRRK